MPVVRTEGTAPTHRHPSATVRHRSWVGPQPVRQEAGRRTVSGMSHPPRFEPGDPWLARLREICLALPGAAEKISHGAPNFVTSKVFAIWGAHVKGDHDNRRFARSVQVKPSPDEHRALLADDRFFVPAYTGPSGWLGLDLTAADPDWDEVAELVDASFRLTAPRRLVAELDAR